MFGDWHDITKLTKKDEKTAYYGLRKNTFNQIIVFTAD